MCLPVIAHTQALPGATSRVARAATVQLGAMVIGEATRVDPAIFGNAVSDLYLTQPNVLFTATYGGWRWNSVVNFEGYTLRRGELNPGVYGEGYADRRHPHTLVHEAMLSYAHHLTRTVAMSLSGGKGFTPFGTDDPMMRPFVKFPVNHHHSQIIERAQVIGTIALGADNRRLALEHAFFNGDEPVGPFIAPQWKRFGDSRTTRLTVMPFSGVELQASRAFVRSPGITQGGAFDHTQTNVSLRIDRSSTAMPGMADMAGMSSHARTRYALVEVARTDEGFGRQRAFRYRSVLAEGALSLGKWTTALRVERTERPENERLLDPFRIANGHIDFQIIGVTQWSNITAHVDAPTFHARAMFTPYVEVTSASARALRQPAVFEPRVFYGASTLWSLSAGIRAHLGSMPSRMGRYGVLARP